MLDKTVFTVEFKLLNNEKWIGYIDNSYNLGWNSLHLLSSPELKAYLHKGGSIKFSNQRPNPFSGRGDSEITNSKYIDRKSFSPEQLGPISTKLYTKGL